MKTDRKTRKKLRGILLLHDMTFEDFAKKHGFNAATVRKALERHWGTGRNPQGEVGQKIIATAEKYYRKFDRKAA